MTPGKGDLHVIVYLFEVFELQTWCEYWFYSLKDVMPAEVNWILILWRILLLFALIYFKPLCLVLKCSCIKA